LFEKLGFLSRKVNVMNGLMHPDDMLDYARKHQDNLLRLVEMEALLKPRRAKRPGYRERLLLGLSDLLIRIGLRARPKDWEYHSPSTCDEKGVCIV
jgi:hypothetical protein